jgi:hypothetical protein
METAKRQYTFTVNSVLLLMEKARIKYTNNFELISSKKLDMNISLTFKMPKCLPQTNNSTLWCFLLSL